MQIQCIAYPGETGVIAVLTALAGATGTPASNYALTGVGALYTGTIAQSLTGEWYVEVSNGAGETMFAGYWTAGSESRCYDHTKEPATSSGGTTFDQAPVSASGKLREIIIGDDYLASNSRAFVWTVPAVTGFTVGSVVARFGAAATLPCGTYSFLVTGSATDNGDGTWKVSINLPGSATDNLAPGAYDWSMTLSSNGVDITKVQNLTEQNRVKLLASPS